MIRALPVRVSRAHGDNQNHSQEDRYEGDEEGCKVGEEGHAKGAEERQEGRQEGHDVDEEGHERETDSDRTEGCPFGEVDVPPHRSGEDGGWWSTHRLTPGDDADVNHEASGTGHVD